MEENYRNRDFEQYVKEHADQHRMFPSEKVWSGIDKALHPRKKWYGFGLAFLLLLTGGAVTWVMGTYPADKKQEVPGTQSSLPFAAAGQKETSAADLRDMAPFSRQSPATLRKAYVRETVTPEIGLSAKESLLLTILADEQFRDMPVIETPSTAGNHLTIAHSINRSSVEPDRIVEELPLISGSATEAVAAPAAAEANKEKITAGEIASIAEFTPLTIESVTNSFAAKPKKLIWQFFITPTVSYRKLSENKSFRQLLAYPASGS